MKPSQITDFEAWEFIFNRKLFGSKNLEIQVIKIQNSLKEHIKPDSLFVIQYSNCFEASDTLNDQRRFSLQEECIQLTSPNERGANRASAIGRMNVLQVHRQDV
jgi:hypothetical protein